MEKIRIKLDDGAYLPSRAHDADAGYDLRTPIGVGILPHGSITVGGNTFNVYIADVTIEQDTIGVTSLDDNRRMVSGRKKRKFTFMEV